MTERYDLVDHTIQLDRVRIGWRARVWRATFDERGVIHGCAMIGELTSSTKVTAIWRARSMIKHARARGAQWPHASRP